ncbi:MAG: response regulator, partial [Myxococcales bacterium]|nr:response regulator [Myxococcales bacterium]
ARDRALDANRAKSAFRANMSHELRTPLNAILGYSEMLFEETTDPQAREDLRRIHASGEHLLTLINDILDISKIESGKMELYLEDFEIRSLISETIATAEPLIERNENRLALDVPPSIGLMHADVTKVRQSLLNLLSNAAKFTSKGTITLTALREREPGGDWIVISVRDTGIGMTPEQQQRIFEPFSQVDASTTRKFGGTGLGLAITRSFCEMMGGTISGVSEQGVGSTFTIRLPAVVSEGSEEVDEDAVGEAPDDAFKVLVIDADNTARHLLRQYFEREGWHVVGAPSCERARARAREVNPHVILLDVELPDCDGWEFLREIKRDDVFGHAPVIVATAIDDKKRAFNLGASEFVTKPIERGQLIRMLRTYKRMLTDDRSSRP